MKFFNTSGPVNPQKHYILSPLKRFNLGNILSLIEQEKYFVMHAPRQTGKTSCLLALRDYLNQTGNYHCLYVNVEVGQASRENVQAGMQAILSRFVEKARELEGKTILQDQWESILDSSGPYDAFLKTLCVWTETQKLPTILLIDEIDALVGDTLISVLRQLRAGYTDRPAHFPQTVVLCGVRDVRDYRMHSDGKDIITGGSAFNIKDESLRLGNFSRQDMEDLYAQHTETTGQVFERDALNLAWELTQGQPWLVNALAYQICFKMPEGQDRSRHVTAELMVKAKETLIINRVTHLHQLADKLKEDRVRRVIEPLLQGKDWEKDVNPDDLEYLIDLGLLAQTPQGLGIANAIYREVIPRQLSWIIQMNLGSHFTGNWYVDPQTGKLDMPKLLTAFQAFFRKHSEHWVERFDYKEAGPQLLMQAFLQRILNGGGRIEREYGLGRGRTDLLVIWNHEGGVQEVVIELKIQYDSLESTIREGLGQTWEYMDHCGTSEGHLIIFNRRPKVAWSRKIFHKSRNFEGHPIEVWGM
ncbi:MAG: AAA-like domain-containing protein [SAR324 cluster bacterium]|nr:AAA-like domain-containing protein [SAR324 cluster bacterium]